MTKKARALNQFLPENFENDGMYDVEPITAWGHTVAVYDVHDDGWLVNLRIDSNPIELKLNEAKELAYALLDTVKKLEFPRA